MMPWMRRCLSTSAVSKSANTSTSSRRLASLSATSRTKFSSAAVSERASLKNYAPRGLGATRLWAPRARDRIEADILRLAHREESLDRRIEALESREDEVYKRWRGKYYDLRYQTPGVTRLFQSAFEIAPASPETSC